MLDLLFPPLCIACGVILSRRRRSAPFGALVCSPCGVAAAGLPADRVTWEGIDAVLPYQPPWSTALSRLKFSGVLGLAGPLSQVLAQAPAFRGAPDGSPWDAVVPVPLHRRRLLARGYDQTLLLATGAGRRHRCRVLPRGLSRTRSTPPQSRLAAHERASNVRGAFSAARVAGLAILLVDDVVTTGATLDACREALLRAGARRVGAVALLRTLP